MNAPKIAAVPNTETGTERAIAKSESRLASLKHIDGKAVALDYIFPLLRKLAQSSGDHEEQIESLVKAVEAIETGGDAVDALEGARDIILKLASILDEAMVAAGFYTVLKTGLQDTGRGPASLRQAYSEIGPEVQGVMVDIQEALDNYADDDDDDDDDDDADDGDDDDADPALESDDLSGESAAPGIADAARAEAVRAIAGAVSDVPNTITAETPRGESAKTTGAPDDA